MGSSRCALALLVLATSCRPSPQPLAPLPFVKPAIPPIATLDDPTFFGYLRVRDPLGLARRFGGKLPALAASSLEALPVDRASALFAWRPENDLPKDLPLVGLVPLPESSQLVGLAKLFVPTVQTAPLGRDTLVALNAEGLARAQTRGDWLTRVIETGPGDLLLQVQLDALIQKYGAALAKRPRALLERWQSLVLGLSVEPQTIELFAITRGRRPAMARPALHPELGRFLPPGDVRFQAAAGAFAEVPLPGLEPWQKQWAETVGERGEWALSASFNAQRGLRITQIVFSDRAEELLRVWRQLHTGIRDAAFRSNFDRQGILSQYRDAGEVRKILGWPVYREELPVTVKEPSKMGEWVLRLFGERIEMETLRIGPYLVWMMNGSADELESIARALAHGEPSQPGLVAQRVWPGGGLVYGDVDVQRLWNSYAVLVQPTLPRPLPQIDRALPIVTLAGYERGPETYYRLKVPEVVLAQVREILSHR